MSKHDHLRPVTERVGGVAEWSTTHNSPLEYSKLALIDFMYRQSPKSRPPLQLPERVVKPSVSTKYLGVIFDQNLSWRVQQAHAIKKGTIWAVQIRCIAKQAWGVMPKYARWLYISIALSRALYTVELWCIPTQSIVEGNHPGPKAMGSAKVTRQLTMLQHVATMVITGGLHTSPTEVLDTCAYLLPTLMNIDKWCYRAFIRMTMLPKDHLLSVAATWLEASLASRTSRFCDLANQTDPGKVVAPMVIDSPST